MMWYPDPVTVRWNHEKQQRTLYACLGVSFALHAVAMVAFPDLRPTVAPMDSPVLSALFASASRDPALQIPRKPRDLREPEHHVPLQKALDPVPAPSPKAEEPAPAQAPSPETDPSPAVASSAPVPAPIAPPAPLPAEATDPSLFDAYRLALIDAAKRYKRYPVQAMERGWEGRVEIRVVVDANGAIKSALVKSSSRYQVLDDQALEMVRKAFNALAQVRPAPRGREFTVDVPVVFELQTG